MTRFALFAALCLGISLAAQDQAGDKVLPLDQIKLPPGFAIEVYASGVDNARQMALGDKGTLFVGSRTARRVYAVEPDDVIEIAREAAKTNGFADRVEFFQKMSTAWTTFPLESTN